MREAAELIEILEAEKFDYQLKSINMAIEALFDENKKQKFVDTVQFKDLKQEIKEEIEKHGWKIKPDEKTEYFWIGIEFQDE